VGAMGEGYRKEWVREVPSLDSNVTIPPEPAPAYRAGFCLLQEIQAKVLLRISLHGQEQTLRFHCTSQSLSLHIC
jgi:hypothetical protein